MKSGLRAQMAAWVASLPAAQRKARSDAVVERLQHLPAFRSARTIGMYMPLPDEVAVPLPPPGPRRAVFIPAFDPQEGLYRMAALSEELTAGRYGIPEPAVPRYAHAGEIDLILVPGMAFDPAGVRLGRGGGWYDRLLPLYRAARVGLCFDLQLVDRLPHRGHDIRMDWIVSETKILAAGNERSTSSPVEGRV